MRPALLAPLIAMLVAAPGCAGLDEDVRASAETVLTLQRGTISELKSRRGTGPFRTYPVLPAEMLVVVRDAAARARGPDGEPVRAIFVSEARREVVAKERAPEQAFGDAYAGPFRTAMVATVHPVPGRPDVSKVEIHAMQRGPFHRGVVAWERDMPGWIDAVLAAREDAGPLKPIP